ncbi:hypothetical protein ACM6XL_004410 [Vibrio vulnificus]|uniref:hypothetical protein n=2 Tax=Vibrio vulnificus TaxID=672 RepID=UPI00131584D7|nr:hypothetical protein [Vibrio vulnificus]
MSKLGTRKLQLMSDGWMIEEIYDPKKGRYNKYYYGKKAAPVVRMVDKISQQYAAYTLIEKDLRSVLFWLKEIERMKPSNAERIKDPDKMNLVKGLFVAALTFYGKCFTACEGRKTKLEAKIIPEDFKETHELAMNLRHNFAAHSGAENFEDVRVSLVLHPDKNSDVKPKLFSEMMQTDFLAGEEFPFLGLVEELQKLVLDKRNQVGEVVLEKIVRPEGKKFWYKKAKANKAFKSDSQRLAFSVQD